MPLAEILPQSTGPYVALMIVGFVVGILGHLSRSRWLITVGIAIIFLAALAFPLALNLQSDKPEPPGPLPRPY
jgi:CHASE2 domain-containing sensor protein